MSSGTQRDLVQEFLEMKDKTERLRSQIEEKNMKGLDPLLAHVGDNYTMKTLSGLRNWWLMFKYTGMSDPPNEDMIALGHMKVEMIEWEMAMHVASAEVYHDDSITRNRKVFVPGGRGLRGLVRDHDDEGG